MLSDKKSAGESASSAGGIWDVHVHCYPRSVIADPVEWARRHRERHWQRLVTQGPQGWADPEELLRKMDAEGIEKVLLQAWYWENADTARLQNDWHAEWILRYPDRFLACAAVHPEFDDPEAELRAAADWGACAVGECLPLVQSGQGWGHPAWEVLIRTTTRFGWPFCIHLTEPVGHEYPGRVETPLMETMDLFERHPDQKWICAHWGGGLPVYSLNRRVARALRNVWFDTAASPLLYDPRVWTVLTGLLGPEKILFGSDFPLILYPRREKEPSWAGLLAEFRESGLAPAALRAIGRENLMGLIGEGT